MILKGPGCMGCPAYSRGRFMCPDDRKPGARVIIVAQNPGQDEIDGRHFVRYTGPDAGGEIYEADEPRPMIGKTGYELDKHFLPLAGLRRDDVECRNVVRCRLNESNDLPPLTTTMAREMVRHCQRSYWKEPNEGQTLVALGAYALWALTGEYEGDEEDSDAADDDLRAPRSIDGWRGWALPYLPVHRDVEGGGSLVTVFATYHPAFYWRAHWLKPVGRSDWARLGKLLKGTWPEPFPTMYDYSPAITPQSFAFDTEYNPWTRELHRFSVAWRSPQDEPSIYVVEARDVERVQPMPPWHVIAQNIEADWPFIAPIFGREPDDWDDTMLMHGVLHGTLRHNLDFMGSCYARHNRWKTLQETNPQVYAGMDALATWDIHHALERELARDAQSAALYQLELKPLVPILLARPSVNLNAMHIVQAVQLLSAEQDELGRKAQALAGWPINIGSADMVARWIRRKVDAGQAE